MSFKNFRSRVLDLFWLYAAPILAGFLTFSIVSSVTPGILFFFQLAVAVAVLVIFWRVMRW